VARIRTRTSALRTIAATGALTRLRVLAAALGSAGILALAFVLGVSPQLAARASAAEQQATVDAANERHRAELEVLRAQFNRIDSTRATLAELRRSIPDTTSMPDFVDQVTAAAAAHSVTLVTYAAQEPLLPATVAPPAVPAPGATTNISTADTTASAADTSGTDPASPTEPAAISPASTLLPGFLPASLTTGNFYALPLTLTLRGGTDSIRAALADLQSGTRLFLLTTASIGPGEVDGESTADLSGFLYIVTGAPATAPAATQGDVSAEVAVTR
jgi:hypothetical protein